MNLGLHVIKCPTGVFTYRGNVPTALLTAIPASKAAVMGNRAFRDSGGNIKEWKFPCFQTREAAIHFATEKGFAVRM